MSRAADNPAPDRPHYLLRLRPGPDCRVPDAVALRRLLKALSRVYDLECVGVWEEREKWVAVSPEHAGASGARG